MVKLDASIFSKIEFTINQEFEFILTQIVECYKMMLVDYKGIENNENKIRNRLFKDYLKPSKMKGSLGLHNYIFHPELPEIDDKYNESSRTDLVVYNAVNYLKNEAAYYVIECKRIDGNKTLNDYYESNGIERFINGKYPTYEGLGGMIGFVVKNIDIHKNTLQLTGLKHYPFIKNFDFSYTSNHSGTTKSKFILYHLMFNFWSIIMPNTGLKKKRK